MLTEIASALTSVVTMVGDVVTALVDSAGALNGLLPIFAVGIAFSVFMFGVKVIKSMCWGA